MLYVNDCSAYGRIHGALIKDMELLTKRLASVAFALFVEYVPSDNNVHSRMCPSHEGLNAANKVCLVTPTPQTRILSYLATVNVGTDPVIPAAAAVARDCREGASPADVTGSGRRGRSSSTSGKPIARRRTPVGSQPTGVRQEGRW
jgi:hypothetical protein